MRGFIDLLVGLLRRGSKRKSPTDHRLELKQALIAEADSVEAGVSDAGIKLAYLTFFKLVRKSFKVLFSIDYECTFEELKKEIATQKMSPDLKSDARVFIEEMDRLEYGFSDSKADYRSKKAHEREEIMTYLKELESEGKRVDKKLRGELNALFKEDASDESKLLIKKIREFKTLLVKL